MYRMMMEHNEWVSYSKIFTFVSSYHCNLDDSGNIYKASKSNFIDEKAHNEGIFNPLIDTCHNILRLGLSVP